VNGRRTLAASALAWLCVPVHPAVADLGLESTPAAARGLAVLSGLMATTALLTLWFATRRHGVLGTPPDADGSSTRGWPFMKRVTRTVVHLQAGVLIVYLAVRATVQPVRFPQDWYLASPPSEARVLELEGETVWAGGKEGLFGFDRKTLSERVRPVLQSRDLRGVRALLREGQALWIGCQRGLFLYEREVLQLDAPRPGYDIGAVTALCRSHDGTLWIGAAEGVWKRPPRGGRWELLGYPGGHGLPTVDVIFQDRNHNMWFGSNDPESVGPVRGTGTGPPFSVQSLGLASHAVNDLGEDHTGRLWVATGFGAAGEACWFTGGGWQAVAALPGISGQKVRSLFEDSLHRFWFCSEYNGAAVQSADGRLRTHLSPVDGLPGGEIKQMREDDDGSLWLATERGLGCIRTWRWPAGPSYPGGSGRCTWPHALDARGI
jgi:ligand-binding sensor domain-containing protein